MRRIQQLLVHSLSLWQMMVEEEDLVLLQVHASWQGQLLLEATCSLVAVALVFGH